MNYYTLPHALHTLHAQIFISFVAEILRFFNRLKLKYLLLLIKVDAFLE